MIELSDDQREHWLRRGWLQLPELLPAATTDSLPEWVEALARPPMRGDEQRLQYFEHTDAGTRICRTERYLGDQADLAALIAGGPLEHAAAAVLDEPAVLYKEKINYKAPGGGGFAAHQDATAYPFVRRIVTAVVAVDAMTTENGCLEFAGDGVDALLPGDGDGCIAPQTASELQWEPVPLPAGGVLLFSAMAPHRSGTNSSRAPRRALYLTYNARSEGDRRAAYYAEREVRMRDAVGEHARVSNIGHFRGRPATGDVET